MVLRFFAAIIVKFSNYSIVLMDNKKTDQKLLENALKTVKALTGRSQINAEFFDIKNNFFAWNQNIVASDRVFLPKEANASQTRAAADLAACYLLFHQKEIHQKFLQEQDEQQELFDAFEKIRVVANVKNIYFGVVKNIITKILQDAENVDLSGVAQYPLLLLQEIFSDQKFVDEKKISPNVKAHIKKLAKNISNQTAFASELERFLEFLKKQEEEQNKKNQPEENDEENKPSSKSAPQDTTENQENIDSKLGDEQSGEEEKTSSNEKPADEKTVAGSDSQSLPMQLRSDNQESYDDGIEFKKSYKVFSNKFDEIILPQKLISKNELELLRYGLDLRIAKLSTISKRLTLKLKKKLLAKKNSFVEQDQSYGVLNRKKFTQIITDPFLDNYFISQKRRQYQDTVVSILLDNSGSMRGQPIVMSALACEIIATILEKFNIKTEILGFTTVDWKGGKSRKMWEAQGRPQNPGRLSDLRHIIYKSANQNFKKAKINLGLMLKEGMLKENIDGEALLWAKGRLMQRDEERKILAIISDGTPVDDSTNSTNDREILVDHLHHVIHRIEKQTKIEIFGIGIGHQVDNFYRNSIAIKGPQELGDVMIEKITKLI